MARLSSTNQRAEPGPILADGHAYTPLPPAYYDLTHRITKAMAMEHEMSRGDPLWPKLTSKIEALTDELQAIVNQTLGAALCPTCTGTPITVATLRARQAMRVCARHDLWAIQLHGTMQREPPGTNAIPSSVPASTSCGP